MKMPQPTDFLGAFLIFLASIRLIFPAAVVDNNTVWLVSIAVGVVLWPSILEFLLRRVKKIKGGQFEIELRDEIRKIGEEVERFEELPGEHRKESPKTSKEIENILRESSKDPRASFLLIASKLEREIRDWGRATGIIASTTGFIPMSKAVELGSQKGALPREFATAFRDFWGLRNRLSHGMAFDVSDQTVMAMVSLGAELLAIASKLPRKKIQ